MKKPGKFIPGNLIFLIGQIIINLYLINMENPKITIVIPTYNEEKTVKDIINKCKNYCDDILVVLSKKSNNETINAVKSCGVEYIFDNGKGKGDAVRIAITRIENGIIVFIDADGSHDPNDIPNLILPIKEDKADLVIGSRMTGGSDELHGTIEEFLRLMFSSIITLIINYRFGVHITDYQNGFRAIRADTAKKLNLIEDITTIEQEMGMKCLKGGYRIAEVPSHEYYGGKSSFNVWRVGFRYLWTIIRYNL